MFKFAVVQVRYHSRLAVKGRTMTVPQRFDLQPMHRDQFARIIKPSAQELRQQLAESPTFHNLNLRPEIVEALDKQMAAKSPTGIQLLAIPEILAGRNVFCAAETGCGKTLAYLAPIMSRLRHEEHIEGVLRLPGRPRALILVPTKELVMQVSSVAKSLSHIAKMRIEGILDRKPKRAQDLQGSIDIIVSTPQKFQYQLENQILSANDLRYVVVDEADTLLEKDFGEHVRKLIMTVKNSQPDAKKSSDSSLKHQTCQFTFVTASIPKSIASSISRDFPGQSITHIVTPKIHSTSRTLKQRFISITGHGDSKQKTLLRILFELPPKDFPTVIFCNKTGTVRSLVSWLTSTPEAADVAGGLDKITALLGNAQASERKSVLDNFQKGNSSILVSTDMASRGLDTMRAKHVILYDFPTTTIDYLHRVGRTARAGTIGRATSLISKKDAQFAEFVRKAISKAGNAKSK